jgi:hypothetical protein
MTENRGQHECGLPARREFVDIGAFGQQGSDQNHITVRCSTDQ